MSEAFLKNPLGLFDIKGKTAVITGASGAFGALAAKTFAGAGANVVLAASKLDELKKVAAECEKLGGKSEIVALRPSSEENCDKIVKAAVDKFGRVDILVVASGLNKVSKIVDQKVEDFLDVMDANVNQSWLMARAAGKQMLKQGQAAARSSSHRRRADCSATRPATAPIARRNQRSMASQRRSAANGVRPASQ